MYYQEIIGIWALRNAAENSRRRRGLMAHRRSHKIRAVYFKREKNIKLRRHRRMEKLSHEYHCAPFKHHYATFL